MKDITNTLQEELKETKRQMRLIRRKRQEIMYRLANAGFTHQMIGDIYGCERQYVTQEIAAYREKAGRVIA